MRKFLTLFLTLMLSVSLFAANADAKRFGGGKSFGKQRESISQPAPNRAPTAAPAAAAPAGNKWLGPLAGLAAGGVLASLFMGHGFDGLKGMDILLMLGLAAAAFFVFRAMRRKAAAPQATAYTAHGQSIQVPMPVSNADLPMSGAAAQPVMSSRPDWFDDAAFVRDAKAHFIRLQAAYDVADLNDIREYTTPEVFAEISLQLQERGDAAQKTDVTLLNADMLNVATEGQLVIASVRFHGLIREDANAPAAPFDEIWHIQKSASDRAAPWFVAGIQQAQ